MVWSSSHSAHTVNMAPMMGSPTPYGRSSVLHANTNKSPQRYTTQSSSQRDDTTLSRTNGSLAASQHITQDSLLSPQECITVTTDELPSPSCNNKFTTRSPSAAGGGLLSFLVSSSTNHTSISSQSSYVNLLSQLDSSNNNHTHSTPSSPSLPHRPLSNGGTQSSSKYPHNKTSSHPRPPPVSPAKSRVRRYSDLLKWATLLILVELFLITVTGSAAFETMSLMTELRPRVVVAQGMLTILDLNGLRYLRNTLLYIELHKIC